MEQLCLQRFVCCLLHPYGRAAYYNKQNMTTSTSVPLTLFSVSIFTSVCSASAELLSLEAQQCCRCSHGTVHEWLVLVSGVPRCRSMMTAVQLAQTHLVTALCCANILTGFTLCKLSLEMRAHSRLLTSHVALTKQATGVSKEYTRATRIDPNVVLQEQLDKATKSCSDMQVWSSEI